MNKLDELVTPEKKLEIIQGITKTGDWQWNFKTDKIHLSKHGCKIFQLSKHCPCEENRCGEKCGEMTFDKYMEKIPEKERIKIVAAFKNAKKTGMFEIKHLLERQDIYNVIVQFNGRIVLDSQNKVSGMIGTLQDITVEEHKRIADNVVNRIIAISIESAPIEDLFNKVLMLIFSIPWISIESKGGIFVNDPIKKQLKLSTHIGFSEELLTHCSIVPHGHCLCGRAAQQKQVIFKDCLDEQHEVRFPSMKDHGHFCIPIELDDDLLGVLNLYVSQGHVKTKEEERLLNIVVNTLTGLIDRKNKQRKLEELAHFDVLTGLPNWRFFFSNISRWIKEYNGKEGFAIFFIDLNNFKTINDTLGHHAGDVLLQQVTLRLRKAIRQDDFLGRKSGDEFVLAIRSNETQPLSIVAQKIINAMTTPFDLDGEEGIIGVSIGISTFPYDGVDLEQIVQKADTSMYHAKTSHESSYVFYSDELQHKNMANQKIKKLLHESVENEMRGFSVLYQPQVNLATGEIVGCEAYVRWIRPDTAEEVPPFEFLSLAEESNIINVIGEWLFKEACIQNKLWQSMGFPTLRMGINVSSKQIRSQRFIRFMKHLIEEYDLNSESIELEIPETAIEGREQEQVIRILTELSVCNISLALDDYGTGQSSLRKLQRFPANTLKIDKSLIKEFLLCEEKCAIVNGVVGFGQSLGKVVIAEGVDTEAQRKSLLMLGCDEIQGNYFSPPVPAAEMEEMLLQNLIVLQKELGKGHTGADSWGWSIRKALMGI